MENSSGKLSICSFNFFFVSISFKFQDTTKYNFIPKFFSLGSRNQETKIKATLRHITANYERTLLKPG